MSGNRVWNDLTGTHPDLSLGDWATMENRWGEFGEPGFAQITHSFTSPPLTGVEGAVDATWSFSRGDDGALLAVYVHHMVSGVHTPIFFVTHPDHQRQGIGTRLIDYVFAKHKEEHGTEINYEESYATMAPSFHTTANANFTNKYIKNIYGQ